MSTVDKLIHDLSEIEDSILNKRRILSQFTSYRDYLKSLSISDVIFHPYTSIDSFGVIYKIVFNGYNTVPDTSEDHNYQISEKNFKVEIKKLMDVNNITIKSIDLDISNEERILKERKNRLEETDSKQEKNKSMKKIKIAEIELRKEQAKIDAELLRQQHELEMMRERTKQEELKYLREQAQLKGIHGNIQDIKDYQKG